MLVVLGNNKVELDQKLARAFGMFSCSLIKDWFVFLGLCRLNAISARFLDLRLHESALGTLHFGSYEPRPIGEAILDEPLRAILDRAIESCGPSGSTRTLGTRLFLRTLLDNCVEHSTRDAREKGLRPTTFECLATIDCKDAADAILSPRPLDDIGGLKGLLNALRAGISDEEDFQFLLAIEGGRVVFRVVSILDDYVQEKESRVYVPRRALLTHFRDQFGGFTGDEIGELEELINNPRTTERQLQLFFELHSHFFRRWDHREVHPQVYLTQDKHPLIPDFILTDRETQRSAIIELKLPNPKVIRRQRNRDRFSAAVLEARSQLLSYRDWFRVDANRNRLKASVGMQVYEPHLAVIIGRSSEFQDEYDRQKLAASMADVEVVSYDDILRYARRRRIHISERTANDGK